MRAGNSIPILRPAVWPAVASAAAFVTMAAWTSQSIAQQPQQQARTADDKGGQFSLQPEIMTFGPTPLYLKRKDSFVLRNHGETAVRNIKADLGGPNATLFSIENGCGDSLAPGQQCAIEVTFEPTSDGDKSAELRVTAGDGAVRTRQVTGSGAVAKYSATPKSLSFGKVASGTTSKEQVITITNTGNVNLPITATSLSGENERQFVQSNDCPRELPVGKSCKSTVRFRPTWEGDHQATLTVWAKGTAPETKVSLSGTGTAARDDEDKSASTR